MVKQTVMTSCNIIKICIPKCFVEIIKLFKINTSQKRFRNNINVK